MPTKRTTFTIGIMAATAVAVLLELVAVFDGSAATPPLTDLIIEYVPQEITTTVVAVLAAWLPVHFASRHPKRWPGGEPMSARRKHIEAVVAAGGAALIAALTDDHVSGAEWGLIAVAVLNAWGVYAVPNKSAIHPGGVVSPVGVRRRN